MYILYFMTQIKNYLTLIIYLIRNLFVRNNAIYFLYVFS